MEHRAVVLRRSGLVYTPSTARRPRFASLGSAPARAVKLRIRATNNVAKITNVMKMVASSKLKSVEDMLAKGKAFGVRGQQARRRPPHASSTAASHHRRASPPSALHQPL